MMYCPKCRYQISQDDVYCANCGADVGGLVSQVSVQSEVSNKGNEPNTGKPWAYRFRQGWREFTRSPWFILLAVSVSLMHLLILFAFQYTDTGLEGWEGISFLNEFIQSDALSEEINAFTFWIKAGRFVLIASGVMAIFGIWITYADSRQEDNRSINTSGFITMKIAEWVGIVGAVIHLIVFYAMVSKVKSLYSGDGLFGVLGLDEYLGEKYDGLLNKYLLLMCWPYLFVLVYSGAMLFVLSKVHDMAASCVPEPRGGFIIAAVTFFVSAVALVESLNVAALIPAVAGAAMVKCHQYAQKLGTAYCEQERIEQLKCKGGNSGMPQRQASLPQNLPAWKRVEMGLYDDVKPEE